jgi:hypothetical protein
MARALHLPEARTHHNSRNGLAWGLVVFELAHNQSLTHFKISSSSQRR